MLKVLANQGFDAIKGLGGYIVLADGNYEIMHRTYVYAPAVEGAGLERYLLAARMLDFPNAGMLTPQNWVPRDLATYFSFNWNIQKAFYSAESLVNEIAGADVFQDVLDSIKTDINGPQIDIEKDLIAHLGTRATLISDYREPITPKSERMLFAIEVINPAAVMKTVNRAMESDPAAKKRIFGELIIWEILNEDPYETNTLQIDGPGGFGFGGLPEDEPEEDEGVGEWGIAGGRVYATALGAMTLEVYYRFRRVQEWNTNRPVARERRKGVRGKKGPRG